MSQTEFTLGLSTRNTLFPIFVKLEQLHMLLVGAGNVGVEKLNALLSNAPEVRVTIVAEEVCEALRLLVAQNQKILVLQKSFENSDLEGKDLVIVASNNAVLNEQIVAAAKQRHLLVNVADKPELCDFYLGSIVQKGALKIAISTNGQSPTIAKRLKEVLKEALPNEIDQTLHQMHQIRNQLKGDFTHKVNYLNKITAPLTQDAPVEKEVFWTQKRKMAAGISLALVVLLILVSIWIPSIGTFFTSIHSHFYYFLLAGFVFSLIDGAIGMSYGVTTTTFALSMGIPPASASAGVHVSEVFTNGIAGWMHYRLKNVNKKMFLQLVIPGAIAAGLGAFLLSSLEHYSQYTRPVVSVYTFILGAVIMRKAFPKPKVVGLRKKKITKLGILGFFGGFIDAVGGGGWGSIVLSSLIAGGRSPRTSLGSVKLSRFFIALISSLTFILMLGTSHWESILGLLIGSSIASPLGVRLSNKISTKTIMIAVGVIVMLTSTKGIMSFLTQHVF